MWRSSLWFPEYLVLSSTLLDGRCVSTQFEELDMFMTLKQVGYSIIQAIILGGMEIFLSGLIVYAV